MSARWKIRFRTSITGAVLAFIFGLAALLIAIQARTLRLATHQAASAYMDATSAQVFGRLRSEITAVVSLVHVLASSSSVANSDAVSNSSPELSVFKTAILELPQIDSIYVGFANGAWLQVRQANALNDEQRQKLRVTSPDTDFLINLVRPTEHGDLPMWRIFENRHGDILGQFDILNSDYDPRARVWYHDTMATNRLMISAPYMGLTVMAPVITISAPLKGKVTGVLAADIKLDNFSRFVQEQRPGEHGSVQVFELERNHHRSSQS